MRRWPAGLLRLYVGAMCVCLLTPIVIVVILAFSGDGYLRFPPTALSLQWFARFFGNLQWQRALLSSVIIGAIACIVSTIVGFFAAYAFLRVEFRASRQQFLYAFSSTLLRGVHQRGIAAKRSHATRVPRSHIGPPFDKRFDGFATSHTRGHHQGSHPPIVSQVNSGSTG